ncbi:hypothetical protein PHLGIDRAFT_20529 [Phlebiopsis gigantea 11061_1 CR5-6]|uniref:Uncharacterized protein n=1 Tax=Phlebiopsis gigantea (strain 11061_1 CR5-6) TaxID=745531 RepID=A0A0C3NC68_PHLG1|nr:hypothetical protein PHLGIDRAFT_20529 [Phlebiopsis gigantea 11061_1 CR5-6]
MPRVPHIFPEPGQSDVADKIRERRGGELIDLDGAMLNAPALALGLNAVGEGVRVQNSLKADMREMIVSVT